MRIYVAGNKLLDKDNLPLRILPPLRKKFPKIIFEELDPSENLPSEDLILIDTVVGISKVKTFSDVNSFQKSGDYSVHDYDFLFELKLNMKLGKIKRLLIIGVPPDLKEDEALKQLTEKIKDIK
jgi:Ni,Fe-hydrogenase maturation factor